VLSKGTCWPSLQTERDSTKTAMSEVELANAEALKPDRYYTAVCMWMFSRPGTIDIEHWRDGRPVLPVSRARLPTRNSQA